MAADRIGHLSLEPECYLAERALSDRRPGTIDVFYFTKKICNRFLAEKWRTYVPVWSIARYLHLINKMLPNSSRFIFDIDLTAQRVAQLPRLMATKRQFSLNAEDEQRAETLLRRAGLFPTSDFVCFFNRDSAYLQSLVRTHDWSYHAYRDSNIENYRLAIDSLLNKGYAAYRMGSQIQSNTEFKSEHPHVFDYAALYRDHIDDDILDIYLFDKAKFTIGAASGLFALNLMLRKNVAVVNAAPFLTMVDYGGKQNLHIPKLYWLKNEKRLMSFREILKSPAKDFSRAEDFHSAGIELIENTPDEIRDVALEMDQKISGHWLPLDGDSKLHEAFNALLESSLLSPARMPSMSTSFLRKHRALLQ